MRVCIKCEQEKDDICFSKHKKNRCILCVKLYNHHLYEKQRESRLRHQKEYGLKNKKAKRHYNNERERKLRKTNPVFRLRKDVSRVIHGALRDLGVFKNSSILSYLSYSIKELKEHLEKQFESWMNWNNQGKYDPKTWQEDDPTTWTWQLDHIVPQSNLPYTSMEDDNFKKCWALSNLRPYSAKLNSIDGATRVRHI